MNKRTKVVLAALGLAAAPALAFLAVGDRAAAPALAEVPLGSPAPDFTLSDANGRTVSLAGFRGKTVVLEWNNPECPSVKKHYDSGNMQRTQAAAIAAGAVWLTINSGGEGKQGHVTPAEAKSYTAAQKGRSTAYLLDPQGAVGARYGARTTPHMYIVNASGALVYKGGIDDKPTQDIAGIKGARNHVLAALGELKAGKAVSVPTSRPYGCSVKYG